MIRVLHVVTYMGRGGLETMLMNYYRHIDRSKVQFDFLVHRDFKADYDDEIHSLGGKIWHMPRLIPWSRSYQNQLTAFFRNHPEYQIVHVHQDCLSSVALKCAQNAGIQVRIAHSHTSNQDHNWKYLIKAHYKKSIPLYATDLLACSKSAGKWMFGGHDFKVVPNAIDLKQYQFNESMRQQVRDTLHINRKYVIGHVGRFDQAKNQSFLIDVLAEVRKQCDAVLLLVGDGDLKEKVKEKAEAAGLSESVIFTGKRPDVNELMQAMDVFVFPSLYEGLPLTTIEAQASGLPCLISDHVPLECKITSLVKQIPLNDSAEQWAGEVLKAKEIKRTYQTESITKTGYNIEEEAPKLQQFYLDKAASL